MAANEWIPDDQQKQTVAEYANRLPEVLWDRFVSYEIDGQHAIDMYGWLPRDDGRADFVLLQWYDLVEQPLPRAITSSADMSEEISRRMYHDQEWWEPGEHVDCMRADRYFDGVIGRMAHQ